jgi:hypothetical protein
MVCKLDTSSAIVPSAMQVTFAAETPQSLSGLQLSQVRPHYSYAELIHTKPTRPTKPTKPAKPTIRPLNAYAQVDADAARSDYRLGNTHYALKNGVFEVL